MLPEEKEQETTMSHPLVLGESQPGRENPCNNKKNKNENTTTTTTTTNGEWVNVSAAVSSDASARDPDSRPGSKQPSPQCCTPQQQDLPSLDECLYGTSRRSPFIPEERGSDEDKVNDKDEVNDDDDEHDDEHDNSHPGEDSNPHRRLDCHDIDMTLLRKLCSQGGGIPDDEDDGNEENRGVCHRAIAWRILLEQLPVSDICATWPKTVPAQRQLYNELVEQYMDHANDHGRYLKDGCFGGRDGSRRGVNEEDDPHRTYPWDAVAAESADDSDDEHEDSTQKQQQQQQQQQQKQKQRIEQPMDSSESSLTEDESIAMSAALRLSEELSPPPPGGASSPAANATSNAVAAGDYSSSDRNTTTNNNNNNDKKTAPRFEALKRRDSAQIRVTEDIHDIFPPHSKYRELWSQSGISLNKGHSAAAIGMNQLRLPEELLREDDPDADEEHDTNSGRSDNDNNDDDNDNDNDADDNHRDNTVTPSTPIHTRSGDDDSSAFLSSSKDFRKDRLFHRYCRDAKLLEEIRKDVVRTHPHLRFYLEPQHNLGIRRHAAIERVLFVWAKLNGNLYVQGMNEIVGTIYYVLANDRSTSAVVANPNRGDDRQHCWADHAEADTYYLFHTLMNTMDIRDVFVADLDDDATVGLHARIQKIEVLLKQHDPEVYNHLKSNLDLSASYYAIRWLTTLLSREFLLPDTIRLWDSMFASTHKENFLRYVCASMVMAVRDRLFRGDFGTCLKLLQNYPSGDIGMEELLESSRALWMYETQISLACQKGGISLRQALKVVPPPPGVIMAFGKPGPKRMQPKPTPENNLGVNVREKLRNVGAKAAANQRVSEMMGKAQRMWNNGWNSGSNNHHHHHHSKTGEDTKNTIVSPGSADDADPASASNSKENSCDDVDDAEGWDIIDSIIDGSSDVLLPGVLRSTLSETSRSQSSKQSQADSTQNVSPKNLWNRICDAGDSHMDDGQSGGSNKNNTGGIVGSKRNSPFWNRVRR